MIPLRSKYANLLFAATLLLACVLGSVPHGHGSVFPAASAQVRATETGDPAANPRTSRAASGGGADRCAICFFSRCASQATGGGALEFAVMLDARPLVHAEAPPAGRFVESQNEARGPPSA